MTCSGNTSLNQHFPVEQVGGMTIWKGTALSFKIHPTSRCLSVIELFNIKRYVDGANLKMEVRSNLDSLPDGAPGSLTGLIGNTISVPYGSVPLNYGVVTIDIPVELPTANIDYWIVMYSHDHVCDSSYTFGNDANGVTYQRFEFSYGIASTNHNRAYYNPLDPCAWTYPGDTNDQVNFASYTNIYSPTCVNPVCNIDLV